MAFELENIVEIIELMENYVEKVRPPHDIRDKLDISYKIDGQSIILFEIRPAFGNPNQKLEFAYAKATYVKSSKNWKIYWMRANAKWNLYQINPTANSLKDFTDLVEEDKYHCFKG